MEKRKSGQRKAGAEELSKLREELNREREKSEDYLTRLKYLQADFENYKRRVGKEVLQATEYANERLILNLLDVIDELEIAIQTGRGTENKDALLSGVQMIHKKLYTTLEREGLKGIETVGRPFDAQMHEVLARVPRKDYEEGMVVEEVRKGFTFKGKVIRQSIVKIASAQGGIVE